MAITKKGRYREGLEHANDLIAHIEEREGRQKAREMARQQHERFDEYQFRALARGDAEADYYRGLAMGMGMYAATGKKLCR